MWEEILRLAVGNGLWAVLFCGLLVYQLRDSRAREGKYQQTIASLCDRLSVVEQVNETAKKTWAAVAARGKIKIEKLNKSVQPILKAADKDVEGDQNAIEATA